MENKNEWSRRDFIKGTIGTGLVLSGANLLTACNGYNSMGLPTATLGKTGVTIPRMAMGLGSRFCAVSDEDKALEILTYALDHGLYYWDTAHSYEDTSNGVVSEERIGKIVKMKREEIFLSTKVASRNPDEARQQIEISLKRLKTDRVDMLKIHSVESMEDVNQMSGKGQLIERLHRMREEGLTRFIGFSGHGDAGAMTAMAERGDFDSMLIAMNHWNRETDPQKRQEQAIPMALKKGMGVMLMKSVRPRETVPSVSFSDLVRFALSVEGPSGVIVGMDSLEVVKSNLDILQNFEPMRGVEFENFARILDPFFRSRKLEWMRQDYSDGHWAEHHLA